MKLKRIFSLSLILSILLAGCGDTKPSNDTDTSNPDDSGSDAVETELTHGLPDDLYYGGEAPFRILFSGGNYMVDPNCGMVVKMDEYDTSNGLDVLQKAEYDRLMMIEDTLGVEFEFLYTGIDASTDVRLSVTSMSDDYDLVIAPASYIQGTIYEGLYMSVNDLPYVDLNKPWWNSDYIYSVSLNADNPYILFGSMNFNAIQRSVCTVFNVDLLERIKGLTAEDMYNTVLEGKWTLDKFGELCKDVYDDENGNTQYDAEDIYALIHAGYWQVDFMSYGAGLKFTERDDDGYPVLSLNNESSITLVEKLLNIFNDKENTYNGGGSTDVLKLFADGHSMLWVERFLMLGGENVRNADMEYGIIPVPKLDETIDGYYTPVESLVQWGLVPITVNDPSMVSAVCELLAYDGYMNVDSAYYDVTLKLKYTRGDDLDTASQMLDIITQNQYTDFLGVNALAGMNQIFKKVVVSGENTFASTYASLEAAANANLESMIKALEEAE